MKKIIISKEFDPYFNIAAEHQLFLSSDDDIHLFLWQNDASVIIGRNQNPYAECNLSYLKEHNIKAVRRFSGGGAVYHDMGNVNFTFITKEASAGHVRFVELIQSAMLKLGIDCEFSGRNDLLYKNQKFSGHAYYTDNDNYMYHGTILVHVDFDQLEKALTPSILKLKSKGIESVKSRVINLSDINKEITTEKVIEALIKTFDCKDTEYISKANFDAPLESLLSSYDWLYGQSPDFDVVLERKYSFGNVSVSIQSSDGFIQTAKISTDSLQLFDFKIWENHLIGIPFNETAIWECLDQHFLNH
ncbi:lipoate--protein ligase [Lacrimispora saccharolytica]|uniref:lipoate--protein ligase n=1 Tax=Lacrimispora saccharolytica (strain ATCC 35040 / DSM 2544 / NRCC 2533 / WM1) TaxID=610130 RepID=D9R7P6_LACSW|nr:lipoate--protein ligase [Lacrimispora saccharolytica]ADL03775.1 lipoyltransferase and lipoate-protein ligase [[Clostridium] saccharolyticum WM1]QRV18096.1 lipoate--protein ligase [Lacrimispora saccharolytica]